MNNRHLQDEQIQEFLERGQTHGEATDHLRQCERCRRRLALYQNMVRGFRLTDEEVFSFKFEKRVLQAIRGDSLGFLHKQLWQVFGGALIMLAFFKLSSLFMDYQPLLHSYRTFSWPSLVDLWPKWDLAIFPAMLRSLFARFPLAVAAALVLLGMAILDQILTHTRSRTLSADR